MTGGNYWVPDAIQYLDSQSKLILGGGLTTEQVSALNDGKSRAMKQLSEAASLTVSNDTLKVINLTGHKLISGYPEGRRMWVSIKWYDDASGILREDGQYGAITVNIDGTPTQVETLLDPHDPNTRIYEAHYGMTREWASQLLSLGYDPNLALTYDRETGAEDITLGELAAQPAGTHQETFHFVLNNVVVKDNRIPTYGMSYDEARNRNALPVPESQYGDPGPGGVYNYWDELALNPPAGATYATIELLYQPTSWEYIQFLYLANNGQNAFLANEGSNLLDAWLNTNMAAPYVMASTKWGDPPAPAEQNVIVDILETWSLTKRGDLLVPTTTFGRGATVAIVLHTVDGTGAPLSGSQVFLDIHDSGAGLVRSLQGFTDATGAAMVTWKTSKREPPGVYTATLVDVINSSYLYDPVASIREVIFEIQ
jgi:hypothetical protein